MSAVKLEDARRFISSAEKQAKEIGQPMNMAVDHAVAAARATAF